MVAGAQERLVDVVVAAVEVAAEAGEAGTYSAEVGRALGAVVAKVGARIAIDGEARGFGSGWREAMELMAGAGDAGARVVAMPARGGDGEVTPG
ncbi:hypothetical protein ACFWXK_32625 [Streptomyces sp. NPDC059070]|uniref:hypothetical protein n=1 Tax=unclassified Streptomyces TaxID=2593676 RepID=UPI0034E1C4E6